MVENSILLLLYLDLHGNATHTFQPPCNNCAPYLIRIIKATDVLSPWSLWFTNHAYLIAGKPDHRGSSCLPEADSGLNDVFWPISLSFKESQEKWFALCMPMLPHMQSGPDVLPSQNLYQHLATTLPNVRCKSGLKTEEEGTCGIYFHGGRFEVIRIPNIREDNVL
ncbi:hypothetical protein NC653_018483 [Populus alba x Populus x berolinensis]|uniref:Uncharacterized protein n=1 Tax=Populus alba x Populus x berolinensis TaxID=444605 RepID=A0AAD6QGM0_9ROSI|nr:hypothetical protein NC653_018483 [Populus alba x Populus x berolinensis]